LVVIEHGVGDRSVVDEVVDLRNINRIHQS
jgi:hypothetical protein